MTEIEPRFLIRLALLVVTVVAVHLAFTGRVPIASVVPEPALLLAIVLAYEAGPRVAAVGGFGAGLLVDLLSTTPVGVGALIAVLVGHTVGRVRAAAMSAPRLPIVGVAVASFVGSLAGGAASLLPGGAGVRDPLEMVRIAAVVAIWHVFLTPLLIPVARFVLDLADV